MSSIILWEGTEAHYMELGKKKQFQLLGIVWKSTKQQDIPQRAVRVGFGSVAVISAETA